MSAFNWIDGLVAFCVVVPGLRGWWSGLVSGLLRLGGLLAGGALGWTLPGIHGLLVAWKPGVPSSLVPWACATACALVGWILGSLVAWLWRRSTRDEPVGVADRVAGLALGLSKGAAFSIVLLSCIQAALPAMRTQIGASWTGRHAVAPLVDRMSAWGARQLRPERP